MMKTGLILFLLFPAILFGQKIQKDQVDKIEGYRVINTSSVSLDWSKPVNKVYGSVFINKNSDTTMSLTLYFRTPTITTISRGTQVILKLDNEMEIELHHAGSDKNYGSKDLAYAFITLDKRSAEHLKNHSLVKYRVETSGTHIDVFIRKNSKDSMRDIIVLLEETMRKPHAGSEK